MLGRDELRRALQTATPEVLYFHFFEDAFRRGRRTGSLVAWIAEDLRDEPLAREFSRINPYRLQGTVMGALLDRYREISLPGTIDTIERLAQQLRGISFLQVNSTRAGGGVAEILHRLVPLFADAGLRPRWEVLSGNPGFYAVTKAFHNALQGKDLALTDAMKSTYLECVRANAERLDLGADAVVIHDPQPAPLVERRTRDQRWIWRCHIDLSRSATTS